MNARHHSGFSLVELMVAMTLGLLVTATVLQIFISSKKGFRTNQALSRVQESGRFALDIMAQDLRQAGFNAAREACGGAVFLAPESELATNEGNLASGRYRIALDCFSDSDLDGDLELDTSLPGCSTISQFLDVFNPVSNGISGHEAPCTEGTCDWSGTSTAPALNSTPLDGTDVVVMRTMPAGFDTGRMRISKHPGASVPASATLEADGSEDDWNRFFSAMEYGSCHSSENPTPGQCNIMVVTSACDAASLFEITAVNANHGEINHNEGTPPAGPGNRTKILGRNYFAEGGFLFGDTSASIESISYYISTGVNGLPALFRSDGNNDEELVDGIESLQLLYGEDSNNDDSVDQFVTADTVADWERVLALRISVLAQSPQDQVTTEPQVIVWNGNDQYNANGDNRLRQVFTTTITLRNRLP
jgi:type IV pilus assembly protein PilW